MVREVLPRVHIYSLALIVSAFHRASSSKVSPVDCTRFDIAELEDYLSKIHPENLPEIDTMIGKFASPVTELPFGALRSDWRRLLLLRRAQPEGSILREKLGRLFRILAVAYFQTNERSDITEEPVFSTTGSSWDCSTSESPINFEEDEEEAETLGTTVTDSTETNRVSESLTSTTLLGREEASRVSEIGLTISDTTEPYDERFDFSTNPIDPSLITIRSSTFDTYTIVSFTTQSIENQNSIEEKKSLETVKNLNNSALDRNNSADNAVKSQIGGYIPRLISSTNISATKTDEEHIESSTNTIDTSEIDVTPLIIDTNSIVSLTTQSIENQNSIKEEKSSEIVKNLNNSALDRNNSADNAVKSQIGGNIPKLISSTNISAKETEEKHFNSSTNTIDTSVITVTSTIFDVNTIARSTTESLKNENTIKEDKSLGNFKNIEDDDLVNSKIDADSRFTTQEHPEINTFNVTSSLLDITTITTISRSSAQLSTTGATIVRDKSLANLGNFNNSDNDDDLPINKVNGDTRFTTQEYQEIKTFNRTSSLLDITTISTIARFSASTSTTIIEEDESSENSKVAALDENDPVNKHQGTKMAAVEEETVGFAKDGSSDHFRGAEVATVAAAVGGFVASKSSVAGAIVEEEDAQPITSPVSVSDTPVTPLGSDFSANGIRGYGPGIMNVEPAERIKESGSVVPTSTEIAVASGRGDSPLVYTPMNSEDQENIAEYRGDANTSDPEMTDVKTMIEQSRVHTDTIRGNEVSDVPIGRQPVHRKDGGSSTPRSVQNSVPYRDKIRKPSTSTEPKVDREFSSRIASPRIVASTTGSKSSRSDRLRDSWSRNGTLRSKKRGSLNTDVEKSYRWFYNAEKEGGRDSNQRGIQIECGENGHDHGK